MRVLRGVDRWIRRHTKRLGPILYAGSNVYCPICDRTYRKFRAAGRGANKRSNAVCYTCKSRERDRLVHKFLADNAQLLQRPELRLLHFAPEPSLEAMLDQFATGKRITADLVRQDVTLQLDIEQLPFEDECFHAIYCSHVLQDIPHDTLALQEMHRVLRADGWALVLVPMRVGATRDLPQQHIRRAKEDAPVMLRVYGAEIEDLITQIGFRLNRITASSQLTPEQQKFWAIDEERAGGVYLLEK